MDGSTPGFPVPHYLPEFAQIHIHWVSDAIYPSHPLLSPSPFAFNLFQHQGLFQSSGGQSVETSALASVLPMNIQGWFILELTGLISLLSKGLSRVFSSIIIWKHQYILANHARGGKNLLKHHNTSLDDDVLLWCLNAREPPFILTTKNNTVFVHGVLVIFRPLTRYYTFIKVHKFWPGTE